VRAKPVQRQLHVRQRGAVFHLGDAARYVA
jgi:hypothetical protein